MAIAIGTVVGVLTGAVSGFVLAVRIPDENAGAAVIPLAVIGGVVFGVIGALIGWLVF